MLRKRWNNNKLSYFSLQLLQQASAAGNLGTLAGLGNLGGAAAGNGNNCYFMAFKRQIGSFAKGKSK